VSAARRRVVAASLLACALVMSVGAAGCGAVGGATASSARATYPGTAAATVAGPDAFERSGRAGDIGLRLPGPNAPRPYPLIVALHSLYHSGAEAERQWGFDDLALSAGFAVVYPEGIGRAWNAGNCCAGAAANRVDDVGWLRALIAHLEREYPLDRERVMLVGLSNGGMLAYRYACEHGEEIAGIGVVAASLQVAGCRPSAPVTVVAVHGGADGHVPYAGMTWSTSLRTAITPVEQSLAPFRKAAGCPDPTGPDDVSLSDAEGETSTVADRRAVADGAASRAGGAAGRTSTSGQGTEPGGPDVTSAPPATAQGTATAGPTVVYRKEAPCAGEARVVEYLIPTLAHGWPPFRGAGGFSTAQVLWGILGLARSAVPGPTL
jgi:poly(3-hydroxybutyrate) depolymerase